uniref:Uncharacterized protein n=1 Tax=Arundo donax TaxID=35708 RepID=A0A0A9B9N2_ARUDO
MFFPKHGRVSDVGSTHRPRESRGHEQSTPRSGSATSRMQAPRPPSRARRDCCSTPQTQFPSHMRLA